jgi:hypothetical protein
MGAWRGRVGGVALLGLGVSISVDELTLGFGLPCRVLSPEASSPNGQHPRGVSGWCAGSARSLPRTRVRR